MNLNHLRYFVKLAYLEHYTKAAKALFITQPSLSHAISTLEDELGIILFERQGRNVILTRGGKEFLKYAESALDILNEGAIKVKSITSSKSGVIDLGYIYTLESDFIPKIVGQFLRENKDKDLRFNFYSGNTMSIIEGVRSRKYDIGFCSKINDEKDLEFIKIKEEELVVVVPKNHELSKYKEVDLIQTIDYKHIAFTKNSSIRPTIDQLFSAVNKQQNIYYEVEKDTSMVALVSENFGIAIMPYMPFLHYFNVDTIKLKSPGYNRSIYMVKLKSKNTLPIISKFMNFVTDEFSDGGKNL